MEKRDTLGKVSTDLLQKTPESTDPIELQRTMQKNVLPELLSRVEQDKKRYPGSFFIVILTKNERLMPNVFRNYFFTRFSCPTPDYDQTVYFYDHTVDILRYLWTLPSRDACAYLKMHALEVSPEERHLLQFVLEDADGTLLKLAKQLNKEKYLSPVIKVIA